MAVSPLVVRVTVLVLCVLFGRVVHQVSAVTRASEVAALNALSEAWPSLKSLNWAGDPCSNGWTGVLCDSSNSTVTDLTLYSQNLKGTIPPAIGDLTGLRNLELSSNPELGGTLPKEIGNLLNLDHLSLQYCAFSGSLPEELGNLSLLSFLGLNGNRFSGRIPASLGNTKLTWFDISANNFDGEIPLARNSPNGIGLDSITSIEHFHFSNNSFVGDIPVEFFALPNVMHVLLNHNLFTGNLSAAQNITPTLTTLRLDGNALIGTVPLMFLNSSVGLLELNLRDNQFSGDVPDFSDIPTLQFLDLSNNKFNAQPFPNWTTSLRNIETLNLANISLSGEVDPAIFNIISIQALDVSNNKLSGTLEFTTGSTSGNLSLVNLMNNGITGFAGDPVANTVSNLTLLLQNNPICTNQYVSLPAACGGTQAPWHHPDNTNCPGDDSCSNGKIWNAYMCSCSWPLVLNVLLTAPSFSNLEGVTVQLEQEFARQLGLQPNQTWISDIEYLANMSITVELNVFPLSGEGSLSKSSGNTIILQLRQHLFTLPQSPYVLPSFYYTSANKHGTKFSTAAIIAIAVGSTVGILVVAVSIFVAVYHKKRADKALMNNPFASWGGGSSELGEAPKLKGARWFSLAELKTYTDNWSDDNQIGVGGYGRVYRGVLPTGDVVAIKRATEGSMQGANEFKNEIELLSRVHHRNLVGLTGFCYEGGEQALVYEFMSNGTLTDHLKGRADIPLAWEWRLEIALASARGLSYLHDHASPPIIHRDVKSANILLNDKLEAKVADFGLSKLAPDEGEKLVHSVNVKGTLGYLDPEYYMTQNLTDKSDVYSFGVVLLEMLTARPPIDGGKFVVREVRTALDKGGMPALVPLLDPVLKDVPVNELEQYLKIALACVEETGEDRPTTREIVKQLEELDVFTLQKSTRSEAEGGKKVKFSDEIGGDAENAEFWKAKEQPRQSNYRYDEASDGFQYSGAFGGSTTVRPK